MNVATTVNWETIPSDVIEAILSIVFTPFKDDGVAWTRSINVNQSILDKPSVVDHAIVTHASLLFVNKQLSKMTERMANNWINLVRSVACPHLPKLTNMMKRIAFYDSRIAVLTYDIGLFMQTNAMFEPCHTTFIYIPCLERPSTMIHQYVFMVRKRRGLLNKLVVRTKNLELVDLDYFNRYVNLHR